MGDAALGLDILLLSGSNATGWALKLWLILSGLTYNSQPKIC